MYHRSTRWSMTALKNNYKKPGECSLVLNHPAESTVNTLINDRQKGKQKMLWGRDGAHNVLQIRTSIASKSWTTDWEKVEKILYKEVA